MMLFDQACDEDWPAPTVATGTPFLNSGAFTAFVPELRALLTAATAEHASARTEAASRSAKDPFVAGTDQLLLCHLFAHARRGGVEGAPRGSAVRLRDALEMGIDYNVPLPAL
jgi:hypothetical protein